VSASSKEVGSGILDGAVPESKDDDLVGILDSIDVPVVVVGRSCTVARFNRAAAETLGVAPADIGRPACDLKALTGVSSIDLMCRQAMADGVPSRHELRIGDRWFLLRIAGHSGTAAQVVGAVLTFTNITAFRASVGQAIYEREYTKTILNTVIEPLVVLDDLLLIQTANRAFYDWFGVLRERTQGVALDDLGDDQWKASGLWSSLKATLAGSGEFQTIELARDFPGAGRRVVMLEARRLVRDGKCLLLLSFRDLTEHKKAEAALREIDRRKDEFLAILAHELRNPLAPIRQASAVAKAASATDEQKRWSHEVIDRQVQHMALLLDDLLDISRVTRGTLELRPQVTDLASIIAMATETARPLIEAKRHALRIEIEDGPARFVADPLRLAQVLSNLLNNAAKYTDPHGEIRVRATCSAETVSFIVADNGIGIPPDSLQEVFAMFSQVKSAQDRSEGGLGIGLALAKGLTQLHQGRLEVHSEGMGRGSEFVVRLPRKMLQPDLTTSEPVGSEPVVSRRVLIADDNRDAADSLAMLLRMEGHEVAVVHDGKHAVETIGSFRPEIAVLDIGMPELDGYEVARHIRQGPHGAHISLIAVTGWGQASDKARAAAAGFNFHMTKPIEIEALVRMLRSPH
jgi:signal transduction histidine kinase